MCGFEGDSEGCSGATLARKNFKSRSSNTKDSRRATNGDSTDTACDADSCSGCSWFSNSGGIEDEGGSVGTIKDRGDSVVYSFSFSFSFSALVSVSVSVSISVSVSTSGLSFVVGRTGEGFKSVGIEDEGMLEG